MISRYHMEKLDKKTQAILKKVKVVAVILGVVVGIGLALYGEYQIFRFGNSHTLEIRTPVIFQMPVLIKPITRSPSGIGKNAHQTGKKASQPLLTVNVKGGNNNGVITAGLSVGQLALEAYKTIRYHESSNGKLVGLNAYCHQQGMVNSVGYDPSHNFCFHNDTEEVATVINWVRNCLNGNSISSCLSRYSSGAYHELAYQ